MYPSNPWALSAWAQPNFAPLGYHDDFEDEDDLMLGQIEDEVDAIEAEIESEGDYIGARGRGAARRLERQKRKLERIDRRAAGASPRKAARLARKTGRVERKIERTEARLERKLERAVASGRMSPGEAAVVAAGAGLVGGGALALAQGGVAPGISAPGPAGTQQAYSMLDYPADAFSGRVPPSNVLNQTQRSPSAGEETRIPLLVAADPISLVTFPIAAAAATATFTAESALIPYAAFQVLGLDVIINGQPNPDALVNVLVSFYGVSGDKNLLYDTQNVSFAGQTKGGSDSTSRRTIAGLRENQILQPTNTISATVTVRQAIANAAAINLTIELAMVGRSIYDPAVRR